MTIGYSSRASSQLTSFSNNACLSVNQSSYSLAIYDRCTVELYYQLAEHFHITQYSDGHEDLNIANVDAGLVDCRSSAIVCPQASESVKPGLFFILVDGDSYLPGDADALVANMELITETEISNGVLKLRLASHKLQQLHSCDDHLSEDMATKTNNHNIRQPLHAIGLFASSLDMVLSDNAQKEILSKILNSCNELNDLLNTSDKSKPSVFTTVGSPKNTNNLPTQPHKVMLIDNNSAVLEATHLLLTEMNCDTYPANNIPEALEILEELDELPDLLIVDYHLGHHTTGEMAIEKICAAAGTKLPAIMVSGSIEQLKKTHSNSNICKVLSKPVDPAVLLSTINHAVTVKQTNT